MMCNFFVIGISKSVGLFFVEFLETFNSSSSATSIIFGCQGIAFSLGSVFVMAVLMKRFSCRTLMVAGGFLFGVATTLSSIAQSLAEAVVYMGIFSGFGQAFMVGPSFVMLGHYFKKRLGLATGIAICGASLGQFILPPFLQYTMDRYTFRGGLLILGGMCLNCMVCGALMRPLEKQSDTKYNPEFTEKLEEVEKRDHKEQGVRPKRTFINGHTSNILNKKDVMNCDNQHGTQTSLISENLDIEPLHTMTYTEQDYDTNVSKDRENCNILLHSGHIGMSSEFLSSLNSFHKERPAERQKTGCVCEILDCSLFKKPLFLVTLTCLTLGYVGTTAHVVFLPPYAKDVGLRTDQIPLLISVMGGCDLVGRLVLGFLADSTFIQRYRILMISILIQGVVSSLTFLAVTFWGLVAVSIFSGLFGGVLVSLISIVLTDFFGLHRLPQALSLTFLFQGSALCAFNPLLGWLRDFTGSYLATYCLIGGFLVVGGMSLFLVPCFHKTKEEISIDVHPEKMNSP